MASNRISEINSFNSLKEKRLILIIDNEKDDRQYLVNLLKRDYEVIIACNGNEAEKQLLQNKELISLVLLDLVLPDISGLAFLKEIRNHKDYSRIPVIVITSDHSAEAEAIEIGAFDFISKPFPPESVIRARIMRIIELVEDRHIIEITERDPLTGLYNKEYCYRYAEQFDRHHPDMPTDAILVDINHFHMINERYGKVYADDVLIRIGRSLNEMIFATGGIVCRREADTFLIYCPHRDDYTEMLEKASAGVSLDITGVKSGRTIVRLRMGVYSEVDKTVDVERRFDRAKRAADSVKDSFSMSVGIYDNAMNDIELYNEQLLVDFHTAIAEKQFKVYYQPKFDIRPEIPVLTSAEALVRWQHPKLGMISPVDFVPLFEKNGLIRELDTFVWRETARQISRWKKKFNLKVPVSVNVSRVDMYDPDFIRDLSAILKENDLRPSDIYLEITETAYTGESEHIIEVVTELRKIGFKIEMDDFGSGYSSLNMISNLPIDALKLDMEFIRNAFRGERDMKMIEAMIDIADYLTVPVIAEGVETEEQFCALRMMGCDVVQGFYFSGPVPVEEYEPFLIERGKIKDDRDPFERKPNTHNIKRNASDTRFGNIAYALSSGFERIYYVNIESGHYLEFNDQGRYEDLQITKSGENFYEDAQKLIKERIYEPDKERMLKSLDKDFVLSHLETSRIFSMTFRVLEDNTPVYYDFKLVKANIKDDRYIIIGVSNVDAQIVRDRAIISDLDVNVSYSSIAEALATDYFSIYYVNLATDRFLEFSCNDEYNELAIEKEGGNFFEVSRANILRVIYPSDQDKLLKMFTKANLCDELEKSRTFSLNYRLMLDGKPTRVSMKATRMPEKDSQHIVIGIRNVESQMKIEENFTRELEKAQRLVNRDALTGVRNKYAFFKMEKELNADITSNEITEFGIVVCDMNSLKKVNDTYGHNAGDEYIKEGCSIICEIFKHSPVFRIGGDEFVAVLKGQDYKNREILEKEFKERILANKESHGAVVAFGRSDFKLGEDLNTEQVFDRADAAMYQNKKELKLR